MKYRFFGHSTWMIEGSKSLLIDPWFTDNPTTSKSPSEVTGVDYIILTHDHFDHMGDAFEIAKNNNAPVVAVFETAAKAEEAGCTTVSCNLGGTVKLEGLEVVFTSAFHSCTSNPSGVVVQMDGENIYHSGDTALFGDMQLIGELYPLNMALLPIGGHFTMGCLEAAKAVELLKPKNVIPMHYNTFDLIKADPMEFKERVGNQSNVTILEPGGTTELS